MELEKDKYNNGVGIVPLTQLEAFSGVSPCTGLSGVTFFVLPHQEQILMSIPLISWSMS